LKKDHPTVFGKAITHTTRAPRVGEQHGINYYYTTREEILREFNEGKFIEKAEIHGNIYGTSVKAVQDVASQGKICILDIDVQGCESAKHAGVNPVCIFLLPPSIEELRRRLTGRGTETPEQIETRMATALRELEWQHKPDFWHYILTNTDLQETYSAIKGIIVKEYPVGKL
jgi:guanylate kinase